MTMLTNPVPMWAFLIAVILVSYALMRADKGDKKTGVVSHESIALSLLIVALICVVLSDDQLKARAPVESNNTDETKSTSASESTDSSESDDGRLSEDELEEIFTHSLELPIEDAVINVGDNKLKLLDNFDRFIETTENRNYYLTSRQNIQASISEYGNPLQFYMYEETEDGDTKYYIYTYVENLSKQQVDIPLGFGSMTELLVNFDLLDDVSFAGFDRKSTYDDVVEKWGKEEYINVDEYCYSTDWGHVFITFNEDGTIHTVDLYIHSAYTEKALIAYTEETLKNFEAEVEKERKAYEERVKETEEAAENLGTTSDEYNDD